MQGCWILDCSKVTSCKAWSIKSLIYLVVAFYIAYCTQLNRVQYVAVCDKPPYAFYADIHELRPNLTGTSSPPLELPSGIFGEELYSNE